MSWNYRVVKDTYTDRDGMDHVSFTVREVYYHPSGEIRMWSAEPDHPSGETAEELRTDYARFSDAFTKPVVDVSSGKAVVLADA